MARPHAVRAQPAARPRRRRAQPARAASAPSSSGRAGSRPGGRRAGCDVAVAVFMASARSIGFRQFAHRRLQERRVLGIRIEAKLLRRAGSRTRPAAIARRASARRWSCSSPAAEAGCRADARPCAGRSRRGTLRQPAAAWARRIVNSPYSPGCVRLSRSGSCLVVASFRGDILQLAQALRRRPRRRHPCAP